jgi:RNA 2',3'-cyclic 3'-phosphodiesterase
MENLRLFVCIEMPAEIKKTVAGIQIRLRPLAKGFVSWARQEGLHITLKFLGEVESKELDKVAEAVAQAAREIKPFELTITGTGGFPNLKSPRVFWVGIEEPTGMLLKLQAQIESEFTAMGFAREDRPFSPHLTIGRVKEPKGVSDICCELQKTTLGPMSFMANELIVMRSDLRPDGPVYTPMKKIKLG